MDAELVAVGRVLEQAVEGGQRRRGRRRRRGGHPAPLGEADVVARLLVHLLQQRLVVEERHLDRASRLDVLGQARESLVLLGILERERRLRLDDQAECPVATADLIDRGEQAAGQRRIGVAQDRAAWQVAETDRAPVFEQNLRQPDAAAGLDPDSLDPPAMARLELPPAPRLQQVAGEGGHPSSQVA